MGYKGADVDNVAHCIREASGGIKVLEPGRLEGQLKAVIDVAYYKARHEALEDAVKIAEKYMGSEDRDPGHEYCWSKSIAEDIRAIMEDENA